MTHPPILVVGGAGDPPRLVAEASRARNELGWQPQFEKLDTLIAHAWQWEQQAR